MTSFALDEHSAAHVAELFALQRYQPGPDHVGFVGWREKRQYTGWIGGDHRVSLYLITCADCGRCISSRRDAMVRKSITYGRSAHHYVVQAGIEHIKAEQLIEKRPPKSFGSKRSER